MRLGRIPGRTGCAPSLRIRSTAGMRTAVWGLTSNLSPNSRKVCCLSLIDTQEHSYYNWTFTNDSDTSCLCDYHSCALHWTIVWLNDCSMYMAYNSNENSSFKLWQNSCHSSIYENSRIALRHSEIIAMLHATQIVICRMLQLLQVMPKFAIPLPLCNDSVL